MINNKLILLIFYLILNLIFYVNCNDDFKYYAVRSDKRYCQNDLTKCGGYFVKLLNTGKDEDEIYISELLQMDSFINEGKIKFAPDWNIIFRGDLFRDYQHDVYQAEAYNIYRLMPIPSREFILSKDTKFYTLGNPHNLLVPKLSEDEANKFNCLKNHYSKHIKNVQDNWLEYLINTGNSVFTVNNNLYQTEINNNSTLKSQSSVMSNSSIETISNNTVNKNIESSIDDYHIEFLFISLTNQNNCPKKMQEIRCVEGLVATYVRSFNHCYIFFECAPRSKDKNICLANPPPRCPKGYSLTSIPSYPNGCLKYFCDPSFLYFF